MSQFENGTSVDWTSRLDDGSIAGLVQLDEDGLPLGLPGGQDDKNGESITASGRLAYSFGAFGPAPSGAFTWRLADTPNLQSGGEDVRFTLRDNGSTLLGYTDSGDTVLTLAMVDSSRGLFSAALTGPLDHLIDDSEDDLAFTFGYTITDSHGYHDSAEMGVIVDDDSPTSRLTAPPSIAEGDSVTGTWSAQGGADGIASTVVQLPGSNVLYPLDSMIDIGSGTLTVRATGTWTFSSKTAFPEDPNPEVTFWIVSSDGDGDRSLAEANFVIERVNDTPTTPESDGNPFSLPAMAVVEEKSLPGGTANHDGLAGPSTIDTGLLGYDFGNDGIGGFAWHMDGLPSLSSQGSSIDFRLNGNERSLIGYSQDGDRVLSIQLTDVATGSYKVALARPLDHPAQGSEDAISFDVGYRVTDADGDSANGSLGIIINDDSPSSYLVASSGPASSSAIGAARADVHDGVVPTATTDTGFETSTIVNADDKEGRVGHDDRHHLTEEDLFDARGLSLQGWGEDAWSSVQWPSSARPHGANGGDPSTSPVVASTHPVAFATAVSGVGDSLGDLLQPSLTTLE